MSNTVELLGYYGGDKEHAMSAWTSTSRDYKSKKERMPGLLKMLASEGHHTPFEKSTLHFLVNTDIATHIHLIKHRVGVSVNAESARYKELKEDKFYIPEDWTLVSRFDDVYLNDDDAEPTTALNKTRCYEYDSALNALLEDADSSEQSETWHGLLEAYTKLGNKLYHAALEDLTPVLGRKRAKESARFFKTYNSQICADVQFNFRSFMHFQGLRNSEHAQLEVREVAQQMLKLVQDIPGNPFIQSLKAFGYDSQ